MKLLSITLILFFVFVTKGHSQLLHFSSDKYEYTKTSGDKIIYNKHCTLTFDFVSNHAIIEDETNGLINLRIGFIWKEKIDGENCVCMSFINSKYVSATIASKTINFCNLDECALYQDLEGNQSTEIYITHDREYNITGIFNLDGYTSDCQLIYIEGEIKKINFDDTEMNVREVVIEDKDQNRQQLYFFKLSERLSNADKGREYKFLKKGEVLKFECMHCGNGKTLDVLNVYK